MDRSDFVAADGTVWHIFEGLPKDYPETGDRAAGGPQAGLTFRANTGEVRLLPRAAILRPVWLPAISAPPGTKMQTSRMEIPDWEDLLRHAVSWPPA